MFENPLREVEYDSEELPSDASGPAALLLAVGRALLSLGTPSHRLEASLDLIATRLGLVAQFFSTPNALFASLGDGERQQTHLVQVPSAGTDLGRLAEISAVIEGVSEGRNSPRQAADQVEAILEQPPRFPKALTFIAFVLVPAPVALLLGGGWREATAGAAAGSLIAVLAVLCYNHPVVYRLYTALGATLAAFLTTLWCGYVGDTAYLPATLAAVIMLLPGLDLTVATRDLATGFSVSGTARLGSVGIILGSLAFGAVLGQTLGAMIVGPIPDLAPLLVAPEYLAAAALLTAVLFAILFSAELRDWPWLLAAVMLGWGGAYFGNWMLGMPLGALIGGLTVGLAGNIYGRITNRPASIMHTPGLIILVPGALGFKSINDIVNADVVTGVETGMAVVLTALAIALGLILASVLVIPRSEL